MAGPLALGEVVGGGGHLAPPLVGAICYEPSSSVFSPIREAGTGQDSRTGRWSGVIAPLLDAILGVLLGIVEARVFEGSG